MAEIINLKVRLPSPMELVSAFKIIGEVNIPKLTAAVTIAIAVVLIEGVTALAAINVRAGMMVASPKPMQAAAMKSTGNVPTAKIKTIPIPVTKSATGIV